MSPHRLTIVALGAFMLITLALGLKSQAAVSTLQADQPPTTPVRLCFYRELEQVCVQRQIADSRAASASDQAGALIEALLAGPTQAEQAAGLHSALPAGASLHAVEISPLNALSGPMTQAIVQLELPHTFLSSRFDALTSDMIVQQVEAALEPLGVQALSLQARDRQGDFQRLSYFLFEAPPVHKDERRAEPSQPTAGNASQQPAASQATPGNLANKAIYLSAGHGWYWSQLKAWRTQRFTTLGLVEDFNNAEAVNAYLVDYLRRAGADVWSMRESDMNAHTYLITIDSPDYSDEGEWIEGGGSGYDGSTPRYAIVSSQATATATWVFTPTTSGVYAVYAWYRSNSNRAPDAQYLVEHAGGTSQQRINQTVHGYTWRYIGDYPFAGGQAARIHLTNQSAATDSRVMADAIRIGGGMGSLCGDTPSGCFTTSQRPRWEEAARYWAKYQGAPPDVYDPVKTACYDGKINDDYCDDVTARPLYAEWEIPTGEDAVYVSWHTNALDGNMRGTQSYIYDGTFTAGSDALQAHVHTSLIHDLRAGWESDWADSGMRRADFGEVRRLESMPGVLLEIAFHDQPDDINALKDPRFEQLAARAVYKGIVQYFAAKDGQPTVFLPEPPQALAIRNIAPGRLRMDWQPSPTDTDGLRGHAATSYRVYTSSDGLGWSNPIVVAGTAYTSTNMPPGQLFFARVTGSNAGGESLPSPVVGARVGWPAQVLIVDGFGRIDRAGLIVQDDGNPLGNNYRLFPNRINSFDYVVQHGTAIALPFDSANRHALGGLPITLSDYKIVDWLAGEEQSPRSAIPANAPEIALSSAEQAALQSYLAGGGLFISGSEVGYDLVRQNKGTTFYTQVLKADYQGDNAATYSVNPTPGGLFEGLAGFDFDDGTHGSYNADWPDYFAPTGGARAALTYAGGSAHTAALQYDNGGCARLVYFGFPFETIYDAPTRQAVMARIMDFLGACLHTQVETSIQSPQAGRYYRQTPVLAGTASSTSGDISAVRLQIMSDTHYWNGSAWLPQPAWVTATGTTTWAYSLPVEMSDGRYSLEAQGWTSTGLSDTSPANAVFFVDTISPTAPSPITPTGGISISGVGVTFAYSGGQDANSISHYFIKLDNGWRLITTPAVVFKLSGALPDDEHTWSVQAIDPAGNISPSSQVAQFTTWSQHIYLPLAARQFMP